MFDSEAFLNLCAQCKFADMDFINENLFTIELAFEAITDSERLQLSKLQILDEKSNNKLVKIGFFIDKELVIGLYINASLTIKHEMGQWDKGNLSGFGALSQTRMPDR